MKGAPLQKRIKKNAEESGPKAIKQVCLLPESMQKAIRELLQQGATIEGAAQSVNDRDDWYEAPSAGEAGKPARYRVTCEAIRDYYNADRELQRERARSLVEGTESITRSLSKTGDLEEGEARYVQAVVMTGLSRINEKDAPLSVKDALRAREELRTLQLKNLLMRFKSQEARRRQAYLKDQQELVRAKKSFVLVQTRKLQDVVSKLGKRKRLTPETFQKIQETYGILAQNVADTSLGPSAEELKTLPAGNPPEPNEASEAQEYYFHSPERVAQETAHPMEEVWKQLNEVNAQEEK